MASSVQIGRRGTRKGDLKEQAILETAEQLLAKKQYADIGIEELAAGAGISRPTFYFYFASKHAVLAALVDRVSDGLYAAADDWLKPRPETAPREWIRQSIEVAARAWHEHGPILRAAVETWGSVPEIRNFWQKRITELVEASAVAIRHERSESAAPVDGPSATALATALIWMSERCLYTHSISATPSLNESELVETLTAICVRALFVEDDPVGIYKFPGAG